jgi:ring-1,2-phenylacetyl-CoA epoxidase subunit PaaE
MSIELSFHRLRVTEVRRETPDAVSICFEPPPELADTYLFRPGQYLTLRRMFGTEDVRRNYSVCTSPVDGKLCVTVKRIDGGVFSSWANTQLRCGDDLDVMAPQGRFTWDFVPGGARRYLAVAGGSGITPILSLLRTGLELEVGSAFTLFYGNRASGDIIFLEALAALKDRYMSRLQLFHFLEDEEDEVELFNGRLDEARLSDAIDRFVEPSNLEAAFICGPGPMMTAADTALRKRGMPQSRILLERFTTEALSSARQAETADLARKAAGAHITVILDGRRARVDYDPARGSVLDNLRAAGLPAPYACKGGVCATCRAKVIEGEVEMTVNYALTDREVAEGYVLSCQAIPLTDNIVLNYDL